MSDMTHDLPSLDETLGQFDQLLGTDTRVSGRPHPQGDVFAACQFAAKLLGLTGNPVRGGVGPDASISEAAIALGLCARPVMLNGPWWKHDHGVIIVREVASKKPFLMRSSPYQTPMVLTGPGRWGKYQPLTRDNAKDFETTGVVLYALLPDSPLSFSSILVKVLKLYPFEVAVYLALTVIIALLGYAVPVSSGMVIDYAIPHRNNILLLAVVALVIGCNLIMLILRYTAEIIVQRLEASVGTHLQAGGLERLFRLSLKFFAAHNSADIMRRFTSLENARRMSLRLIVTTGMDLATLVVGLCVLTSYFPLGALAVVLMAGLSLLLAYLLGKHSFAAYVEGEAMTTNVMTVVYELVNNMLPIKMFGAERRAFSRWRDNFVEMRRRTVRSARYANLYSSFQQSVSVLMLGLVFAIIAYWAKPDDGATVGYYVAFVGSLSLVTGSVASLASTIMSVFSLTPMVNMAGVILSAVPESVVGRKAVKEITGEVEFAEMSFRYADEAPWVLSNLSLVIKPGEYVGITGASGCGKSTLVKLLLGLLPPSKGQIYFDKNDLVAVDIEQVRQQCGVVLQDHRMFSGSILENITAGRDLQIERVMSVLDAVGMGVFVRALPMSIHTAISEGSATFSGGQLQLMALARALAGDPKLLIFDEATSALDNNSLKVVCEVIEKLTITRFVFTHRLGTLRACDKIIVLERGGIVQQGNFNALAQESGLFNDLLNGEKE
ncbi:MAG: ATP-binding cassette domain-containing protein [Rhodospirillales bacterium]|nr:ATP-binding cassette domain-containing protein [Rhodospirillales bacterium]